MSVLFIVSLSFKYSTTTAIYSKGPDFNLAPVPQCNFFSTADLYFFSGTHFLERIYALFILKAIGLFINLTLKLLLQSIFVLEANVSAMRSMLTWPIRLQL